MPTSRGNNARSRVMPASARRTSSHPPPASGGGPAPTTGRRPHRPVRIVGEHVLGAIPDTFEGSYEWVLGRTAPSSSSSPFAGAL
ncbi:hypothetical protein GCM10023320_63290 [Pseudonocardia adelaidensis]|uniref:Uncharacterized protein n=1 Tax=Pseudonocardia adelaidensis TaxID=648754 RepID=A0ABP9NYK6_9PSEU